MAHGTCRECGATDRHLPGRGLCAGCYDRRWVAGTLEAFPCLPRPTPPPVGTHKVCPICKVDLPMDAFTRSTKRRDGRASYCRPCRKEKYERPAQERKRKIEPRTEGEHTCRVCKQTKHIAEFYWERAAGRPQNICKPCRKLEDRARWYTTSPRRKYSGSDMQWQQSLWSKFRMTKEDYERLLEKQGGGCAICGRTAEDVSRLKLSVDHCHSTETIRGLLCGPCNCAIGLLRDRPDLMRLAAEYVEAHN